jgi:hypothetical protein
MAIRIPCFMTGERKGTTMSDIDQLEQVVRILARRFVQRATVLNLKGKRRDEAAADYFHGACASAEMAGNGKLAARLATVCYDIVDEGHKAVLEHSRRPIRVAA